MKTLPISISMPYGLSAGMLPYLPLPAKMRAAVLDLIEANSGEDAARLASRVEAAMRSKLTELTAGRIPFLGIATESIRRHQPVAAR